MVYGINEFKLNKVCINNQIEDVNEVNKPKIAKLAIWLFLKFKLNILIIRKEINGKNTIEYKKCSM